MLLNKLHFPVTTLGYGRRVGIWFQGCSIRCPGCVSRDTWESNPRHEVALDDVMERLAPWLAEADGVTISGGEPFDQPEALEELLQTLWSRISGDLLIYSGYAFPQLERTHPGILALADVLISEPFRQNEPQSLWLRGSDNQRVHMLTELGTERYGAGANAALWPERRTLDVMEQDGDLWLAGIPAPGMLARFRAALARRGHDVAQTSQQPGGLVRA